MSEPLSPANRRSVTDEHKSPNDSPVPKHHRSSDIADDRHSSSRHRRERDRDRERERDRDSDRKRRSRSREDRDRERRKRSRSRGGEDRHRSERGDRDKDRDSRREREDRDKDRDERDTRRRRKRDEEDTTTDGGQHSHKRSKDDRPSERSEAMDIDPRDNGHLSSTEKGRHRSSTRASSINGEIDSKAGSPPIAGATNDDIRSVTSSARRSGQEPRDRERRSSERDHPSGRDQDHRSYSDRRDYGERKRDSRDPDYRRDYDRDRRDYAPPPRRYEDDRPRRRRPSPSYDMHQNDVPQPDDDSEARSVFVSQLAARLTARDLGYFFEDKLGEGTVRDSRIVSDRISRRSKGIGYVELASIDLVSAAIALTGTVVMGLPIMIQLTESERNKQQAAGDLSNISGLSGLSGMPDDSTASAARLYVGSLHFNLTESDIKQVFEPFGELEFVDLHKDPQTGRSKGYAFVQYKRSDDAKMALEQMEGFELAGRQLKVNTVHEKGSSRIIQDSLDEAGGGNLNSVSRQALMQKLARTELAPQRPAPIMRMTNIPTTMTSRCLLLKNMFNPEEETERDWDKELAADVKEECETKYGAVEALKVETDSQGEIYIKFATIETATKALQGLNGRWFGGNQVSANYVSDAIMLAHLG